MQQIKVMPVVGTRPEVIKLAPVIKKLNQKELFSVITTVTGQHREMLDQMLDVFALNVDYDLDIMNSRQTLTEISTLILEKLVPILKKEAPDLVLVQGDTTTAFVGSLAAFYAKTRVAHVEAGLRTGDKYAPFPEEINRRLTGVLADIHLTPTDRACGNLMEENVSPHQIYITGNPVIDALQEMVDEDYQFENEKLQELDFQKKEVVLLTCHRRENLGQPLENVLSAVCDLLAARKNLELVFPVHLNPEVRQLAEKMLGGNKGAHLLEPLSYRPFVNLMARSDIILTDSGGVQEEGPGLGVPVLVTREVTERPEGQESKAVKLVGTDRRQIVREVGRLLEDRTEYEKMVPGVSPYGDGRAAERIRDVLLFEFGITKKPPADFSPGGIK